MVDIRGFNFIEDYTSLMPGKTMEDSPDAILSAIEKLSLREKRHRDIFDNREYEMKRFIAWFYSVYPNLFDFLVKKDESSFLNDCIMLYDPRTGNVKPPTHCDDYSVVF